MGSWTDCWYATLLMAIVDGGVGVALCTHGKAAAECDMERREGGRRRGTWAA